MTPATDPAPAGTVLVLTAPFGAPERSIVLDRPMAIAEIVAAHRLVFRLPTVAVLDGEPVMRGEWAVRRVGAGEVLAFIAVPRGGGGGGGGGSAGDAGKQIAGLVAAVALSIAAPMIGAALFGAGTLAASAVSAAVMVGGALLLNAVLPPARPPESVAADAGTADQVYSVRASNNRATPLEPVPVLYGRLRYPPRLAARPYTEYRGNDEYLYQLFAVTAGRATLASIDIGETELWSAGGGVSPSFSDVSVQIVLPGQNVTLFPANVVTAPEVAGQPVPDAPGVLGPFVVNAAGTTIDRIAVDFAFPAGLFRIEERGIARRSVTLTAQYRPIDAAGNPTGSYASIFSATFNRATRTPQRLSRAADVPPGRYEVRLFAGGAFSGDGTAVDTCVWTGLRGYLTDFVTPPGCTLLAIRMRATEQLSQLAASQISVTAQRWLDTFNPIEGQWTGPWATRSIAWAAADVLRNADYSVGLTDQQFDLPALMALDAVWEDRNDRFDALFDRSWTVSDALRAILRAGRAQPVRLGGRIGFRRLEPKAIKRAVFSPRNVVRGSFQHRLVLFDEDKPDSVRARYIDGTTWQDREVVASLASVGSDLPQEIEYFGITDRAHAWREAVTDAAVNAYQREFVGFLAEWEGALLVRGDPILVHHPFIEGVETAALAARDGDALTLDRDLAATVEGTAFAILRGRDGSEWGPCLIASITGRTLVLDAGDRAAVEAGMGALDTLLPGERDEPAHVLVCEGEVRPFNGLVVSATPSAAGRVEVLAAIDAPEIYLADGTETMPSPWAPPVLPPANPARPLVLGLYAELRAAVAGLELDVMWQPAAGATRYVAEVSYDDEDTWTPVYEGTSNRFTTPVLPQPLVVRVAAVGILQGPWAVRPFALTDVPDIRLTGFYLYDGVIGFSHLGDDVAGYQSWIGGNVRELIEQQQAQALLTADQELANALQTYELRREMALTAEGVSAGFQETITLAVLPIEGRLEGLADYLMEVSAGNAGDETTARFRATVLSGPSGYGRIGLETRVSVVDPEAWRGAAIYLDTPNNPAMPTRVVVRADQFVVTGTDAAVSAPFVFQGGQVWIAAGRVRRASIDAAAIGSAQIDTLVVQNAHIANLTIGTTKAANNAWSATSSATQSGTVELTEVDQWVTLATLNVANAGGSVVLSATARAWRAGDGTTNVQAQIRRGTTVLRSFTIGVSWANATIAFGARDTSPGSGNTSYNLRVRRANLGDGGTFPQRVPSVSTGMLIAHAAKK